MPGTRASTASRTPGGRSAAAMLLISAAGPSASTDFSGAALSGSAGASALPHAASASSAPAMNHVRFRILSPPYRLPLSAYRGHGGESRLVRRVIGRLEMAPKDNIVV